LGLEHWSFLRAVMTAASTDHALASPRRARPRRRVLPGFRLSLGVTLVYLSLIVLIPLAGLVIKTSQLSWAEFVHTVFQDRFVVAAYKLSFSASILAAAINGIFGLVVAWVLVRYRFFGKRVIDALVDFPFALPTAVAGLTFANLYNDDGWLGKIGLAHVIVNSLGWILNTSGIGDGDRSVGRVVIVLVFVGLPFVVRTVQPILQDLEPELEEAAGSLGAGRWYTFRRVIFPELMPAWLAGLALAVARAIGEYGSVVFVAGNIPGRSQIAPQAIITELDDFKYARATAIGVVLLVASLLILLAINGIEWWVKRKERTVE
jgi:sulfate/thiosulfate transport system permease protein